MYQTEAILSTRSQERPRQRAKSLLAGNGTGSSMATTRTAASAEKSRAAETSTCTQTDSIASAVSAEAASAAATTETCSPPAKPFRPWLKTYQAIADATCEVCRVTPRDLVGKGRHLRTVTAREIITGLTRANTIYSYPQISRLTFHGSNHSNSITAHRRYIGKMAGTLPAQVDTLMGRPSYAQLVCDIAARANVRVSKGEQ